MPDTRTQAALRQLHDTRTDARRHLAAWRRFGIVSVALNIALALWVHTLLH